MQSLVASRATAPPAATSSLVTCGGSPTASNVNSATAAGAEDTVAMLTYERINSLLGQQCTDEFVARAQEEEEISIYTSNTDTQPVVDGSRTSTTSPSASTAATASRLRPAGDPRAWYSPSFVYLSSHVPINGTMVILLITAAPGTCRTACATR